MITTEWDDSQLRLVLGGLTDGLRDLTPIWPSVHQIFVTFMHEAFTSEGAYAGERWVPLNPAYAAYKQRHWGPKPILQRDGTLMASFVNMGDPNHVYITGPTFAEMGSRVHYAPAHQWGYPPRNLPARPMIREFTRAEGEQFVDVVLAYLLTKAQGS